MDSGTIAIRMPVTEESIQRSPNEITEKGITNSAIANAQIAALCFPREWRAPRRHAIGSRIRLPSITRPKATTTGDSSCTDSLIKKYGSPQMTPSAAKAPHPRQLNLLFLGVESQPQRRRHATRDRPPTALPAADHSRSCCRIVPRPMTAARPPCQHPPTKQSVIRSRRAGGGARRGCRCPRRYSFSAFDGGGRGEPAMPFFNDDRLSLHYLERGRGEPLLLIHGLGCSGADWAFQVAALEKRFRVIVPDLPGSGHSPPPPGRNTTSKDSPRLSGRLLDHLGVSRHQRPLDFLSAVPSRSKWRHCVPRACPGSDSSTVWQPYRPDDWRKWLEVHVSAALVRLLGMRRAAWLLAVRLFPEPWQRAMRERAAAVVGAVPASSYLGMGLALARWGDTRSAGQADRAYSADCG